MVQLDAQATLIQKFFERRNLDLIRGIRKTRSEIAERTAYAGGNLVGPLVDAATSAFDGFGRGLVADIRS